MWTSTLQVPQKPEDTFNFELIDTDDPLKSVPISDQTSSQFELMEMPKRKPTPESSRKTIDSDNYVSTVLSKSLDTNNSSPCEIVTESHLVLENRDSQSSASTYTSSLDGSEMEVVSSNASLKPHKPLTRQSSGKSTHEVSIDLIFDVKTNPLSYPENHLIIYLKIYKHFTILMLTSVISITN